MINPDLPVQLTRHLVVAGDVYHPRTYEPGELPDGYLIEGLVVQGEVPVQQQPLYKDAITTQEVKINVDYPNAAPASYPTPPPVVGPLKIQINTAPLSQLSNLPGIGTTLAMKIDEERKVKPFEGFAELKERVKGVKDSLCDRILFDLPADELP